MPAARDAVGGRGRGGGSEITDTHLRHTTTSLLRTEESAHAGRAPLLRLPVLHGSCDGARRASYRKYDCYGNSEGNYRNGNYR